MFVRKRERERMNVRERKREGEIVLVRERERMNVRGRKRERDSMSKRDSMSRRERGRKWHSHQTFGLMARALAQDYPSNFQRRKNNLCFFLHFLTGK